MKPLCILVTGEPVPAVAARRGTFAGWVRGVAAPHSPAPVLEVDARVGAALPRPEALGGVVITGSAASVTERAPWMLRAEAWLRELHAAGTPSLGICFGHQLMGQALGGQVERNPGGREIGTVAVELLRDDELHDAAARPFLAHMTHVDAVVRLPPGASVVARTALSPHASVRFGPAMWGVQFHPEFDADVVRGYVEARAEALRAEGLDAAAIAAGCREAPAGTAVLERFARRLG